MDSKSVLQNIFFGKADIEEKSANAALLLLRFYAGYTIMMAGLDKLPLTDWMVDQVTSMGFPFPVFFAWVASFSEFAFGFMLLIGLATRLSALVLAVTMGVAAFGFQKVMPLTEMHIAQHFFWIYVLFMFLGAGKYSVDNFISNNLTGYLKRITLAVVPVFIILLTIGLIREYSAEDLAKEESVEILSINVAGSFNDWNPTADELKLSENNNFSANVNFEKAGLVEFKFTANKSWDINWGEEDQGAAGFPVNGIAETDTGGNTNNIEAYIPAAGSYNFNFNSKTFTYTLDTNSVVH